jgi:tRNA pseudouridine38-40 synthase
VRISDSYDFPAKGLTLVKIDFPPADQYSANYYDHYQQQLGQENEGDF